MEHTTQTRPTAVFALFAAAIAGAGLASWAVLEGERIPAGIAVGVAGLALVIGDLRAREIEVPRVTFAGSIAERIVDGALFGALAWALLPGRAGVAAIAALGASYVATYLRAKATGLGFEVEEPLVLQPLRMLAVTVGLLASMVEAGLWTAAGVSLAAAVARTLEVAEKREPA